MSRFRTEDFPPKVREQIARKLKELEAAGRVRTHKIHDEPDEDRARLRAEQRAAQPKESKLERRFVQQLTEAGIGDYERNWFPILGRNWELDFSWPQRKIAVEVDGMVHRTKGRFVADKEKLAELLLAGWRVICVCGEDIRHGRAIAWTKRLLA